MRHCAFGLSLRNLHSSVFQRLFYGKSVASLQAYLEPFINEKLPRLWYFPALLRLQSLQESGMECVIFSNSPSFLVAAIGRKIGIEKVFATEYQSNSEGKLASLSSLMDGSQKAQLLKQMDSKKTIAFSDSVLDLPFLEAASQAVAVNPKKSLRKIAKKGGWEII
jgi:HAD superfamily phosphoserine phosphatase-like hydrolase